MFARKQVDLPDCRKLNPSDSPISGLFARKHVRPHIYASSRSLNQASNSCHRQMLRPERTNLPNRYLVAEVDPKHESPTTKVASLTISPFQLFAR